MSAPTLITGGTSTLNRKWILEVDTTPDSTATYIGVGYIMDFQPSADEANWVDDSDFGGQGFLSQSKTAASWSATCTLARKVTDADPTLYDAGQEYLRTHAIGVTGPSNSVNVRFYEYDTSDPDGNNSPRIEAYSGKCGIGWAEQGGDTKALDSVVATLTGQGKLLLIDHPFPATTIPVIDTLSPTTGGTAGGGLTQIVGRGFTGATAVKYGTVAATNYDVINDNLIVATIPAHTAGSVQVFVTNVTGTNTAGPSITYS